MQPVVNTRDTFLSSPSRVLIAFKPISKFEFEARPLTWTEPDSELITPHFDEAVSLFKAMFGFSDSQLLKSSILITSQGKGTAEVTGTIKDALLETFETESAEILQDNLKMSENQIKKYEAEKDYIRKLPSLPNTKFASLKLVKTSRSEDQENLAVVSWTDSGVLCTPLNVIMGQREASGENCMKTLFYVWCKSLKRFPASQHIFQRYEKTVKPYVVNKTMKFLLKPKEVLFCKDCGFFIECANLSDWKKFSKHKRKHEIK